MPRDADLPPLSENQLEIMNIIWDRNQATVAEVWAELSKLRKVARNTVQTMLTRLEERGWLKHREEAGAFVYVPTVRRQTTLRKVVKRLVDTAFAGSADELVMALLEGRGVSKDEAERIRQMIDEAEGRQS